MLKAPVLKQVLGSPVVRKDIHGKAIEKILKQPVPIIAKQFQVFLNLLGYWLVFIAHLN